MFTILTEIAVNTLIPAFWVAVAIGFTRFVRGRYAWFESLLLSVGFAVGQIRILGGWPWPPTETAQALVFLVLVGGAVRHLSAAMQAGVAFGILQVGLYFVLVPIWPESKTSVGQQVLMANGALAVIFAVSARVPARLLGGGLTVAAGMIGAMILSKGSTSLAMSAWLVASMTAVETLASRPENSPRTVAPAALILLALEAYNYV
ncbi:MAG: hypothetical protein AAFN74_16400 [Myxococcota bacterium]